MHTLWTILKKEKRMIKLWFFTITTAAAAAAAGCDNYLRAEFLGNGHHCLELNLVRD